MKKRKVFIQYYDSPCGLLSLASADDTLCLCDWSEHTCVQRNMHRLARMLDAEFEEKLTETIRQAKAQLDEYFAGTRKTFDIPLQPVGTDFQQHVWAALLQIPYGETRTYGDIAKSVGNVKAVRAVAQAIGANGIAIFIPCHRVIGADHSLTGFAGGIEAKRFLLDLEKQRG